MTPWTAALQAPPSMGFPRQEYWSGVPFPSPGDFPDKGIQPASPALAGRFFTAEPLIFLLINIILWIFSCFLLMESLACNILFLIRKLCLITPRIVVPKQLEMLLFVLFSPYGVVTMCKAVACCHASFPLPTVGRPAWFALKMRKLSLDRLADLWNVLRLVKRREGPKVTTQVHQTLGLSLL